MDWIRRGAAQVSDVGYRVQACRVGEDWRFSAWGPDRAPGWSYREFSNGRCAHWAGEALRTRYAPGEAIPQRYELLGAEDSAAGARGLCEAHAAKLSQTQKVEAI